MINRRLWSFFILWVLATIMNQLVPMVSLAYYTIYPLITLVFGTSWLFLALFLDILDTWKFWSYVFSGNYIMVLLYLIALFFILCEVLMYAFIIKGIFGKKRLAYLRSLVRFKSSSKKIGGEK